MASGLREIFRKKSTFFWAYDTAINVKFSQDHESAIRSSLRPLVLELQSKNEPNLTLHNP